jgi:hypothetical protein
MPIQQIREIIRKDIRRQLAFSTKKYRKYVRGPRGGKLPEFFRRKKGKRWQYFSRDMDGTIRRSTKRIWLTQRYGLYNQKINLETPVKITKAEYDRVFDMTPADLERHTTVTRQQVYR